MFVLDTSVISALHRNYYRKNFVSLWSAFDAMTNNGEFTSTREALRELEDAGGDSLDWANKNATLFTVPHATEGAFVAGIYAIEHFQANIERKKLLRGGRNADPFLIARVHATGGTLVTMEQLKPNAAKIPNICEHFKLPCVDLSGFMDQQGWVF